MDCMQRSLANVLLSLLVVLGAWCLAVVCCHGATLSWFPPAKFWRFPLTEVRVFVIPNIESSTFLTHYCNSLKGYYFVDCRSTARIACGPTRPPQRPARARGPAGFLDSDSSTAVVAAMEQSGLKPDEKSSSKRSASVASHRLSWRALLCLRRAPVEGQVAILFQPHSSEWLNPDSSLNWGGGTVHTQITRRTRKILLECAACMHDAQQLLLMSSTISIATIACSAIDRHSDSPYPAVQGPPRSMSTE